MVKTRTAVIGVLALLLLLCGGALAVWKIWFSRPSDDGKLKMEMFQLLRECGDSRRAMQIIQTQGVAIRITNPSLSDDGQIVLPAVIEIASPEEAVLTNYDLVVFDDENENNRPDPGENLWTWTEDRPEVLQKDRFFSPPTKEVSSGEQPVDHARYTLTFADSLTGERNISGIVDQMPKTE